MEKGDQSGCQNTPREKKDQVEVPSAKKKTAPKSSFTITINFGKSKKKESLRKRFWEGMLKLVVENYIFVAACHVLVFLIILHRVGVNIHG